MIGLGFRDIEKVFEAIPEPMHVLSVGLCLTTRLHGQESLR